MILFYRQKQSSEVFYEKGVLRNFTKITGKHLYQSLFFNKVTDLRPVTLLKKRHWHRCFPVNFAKFLYTFFTGHFLATASLWKSQTFWSLLDIQKQPPRGVLSERCSENMEPINRRTLMLKCNFNKVATQLLQYPYPLDLRLIFWITQELSYFWKSFLRLADGDCCTYSSLHV